MPYVIFDNRDAGFRISDRQEIDRSNVLRSTFIRSTLMRHFIYFINFIRVNVIESQRETRIMNHIKVLYIKLLYYKKKKTFYTLKRSLNISESVCVTSIKSWRCHRRQDFVARPRFRRRARREETLRFGKSAAPIT